MIHRKIKEESGYSLVEVIVAIMLLGLAIIPMVSMFDAGLRAAVLGSNYDQARALAGEQLAEVKALPYNVAQARHTPGSAVTGTEGDFDYTINTTYMALTSSGLQPEPDARSMMRVEVEVRWDDGSKTYSTTGLVSR